VLLSLLTMEQNTCQKNKAIFEAIRAAGQAGLPKPEVLARVSRVSQSCRNNLNCGIIAACRQYALSGISEAFARSATRTQAFTPPDTDRSLI
jgi:hypothetical protein